MKNPNVALSSKPTHPIRPHDRCLNFFDAVVFEIIRIGFDTGFALMRHVHASGNALGGGIALRLFQRIEFQLHLIGCALDRVPAGKRILTARACGGKFQHPLAGIGHAR